MLPPINRKQNSIYSIREPYKSSLDSVHLRSPEKIGILSGIPKYFTVRRRSRSEDYQRPKIFKEKSVYASEDTEEHEETISPMTILVRYKNC